MTEPVPEWILGPFAQSFLDAAERDELIEIIATIASILLDPSTDGETKFDLNYYPFTGLNVRGCRSGRFLIVYRPEESGSIYVYNIFRLDEPL